MKYRMFKPGDRVQRCEDGPVMIVQKYAREYHPLLGWHESNCCVLCTWYDRQGYHKEKIHQNNLFKVANGSFISTQKNLANGLEVRV